MPRPISRYLIVAHDNVLNSTLDLDKEDRVQGNPI